MSIIPPTAACRWCASSFAQPVNKEDIEAAQHLADTVYLVNCLQKNPPLADIVYRPGLQDWDILHQVVRWDTRSYDLIFQHGFQAWPQVDTPNTTYYDLNDFVQNAGAPLDSHRRTRHAFVSTTLNLSWLPEPSEDTISEGVTIEVYRYEIHALGGIWVAPSINNQFYNYSAQDEVCFVAGIAPQYIRSAQLFKATREVGSRHVSIKRADNTILINGHFNPQSDPYLELPIQNPIFYYNDENNKQSLLSRQNYTPSTRGQKRQVSRDNWCAALKWYGEDVAEVPSYINAAFRSSRTNEAYLFMKNEYVLVDYAPRTSQDKILYGPHRICGGYPSLIGTSFGEHGIDCAFDTHDNEAFIFSANLCAYIDYAPITPNDKILSGTTTITAMFPFFKRTVFENGIDAAFKSTKSNEAYLFRGDQCALINYDSKNLIYIRNICDGFHSLKGTIFASGIDAAFASHREDQAYLFKGEYYVRINFNNDSIIGEVHPILPNKWPSLRSILPRKNGGIDIHHHRTDE